MKRIIKKNSLRLRLIVILSLTALFIWAISTAIAWFQVRKEVSHVFDAQQILFAQRLASSDLRNILIERHGFGFGGGHRKKPFKETSFDDDALAFAIFTAKGDMLLSDGKNGENFVFAPRKDFTVAPLHGDDDPWRIYWLPVAEGRLFIAVGQEIDYRADLVNKMVFGQMWVWIGGLPLLIGLIIFVISKELAVLRRVSNEVVQRSPEDQTPLATENVPNEILPLVQNLNAFFDRTSTMFLRERRFTSDAAHELRSPLAALRIQTEVAQIAGDDAQTREQALKNLTQGIDRATQLVEQLLTLSRLDNLKELEDLQDIHWDKLTASLIGELYFAAQKRRIDLNFEQIDVPHVAKGQPLLLSLMLRNLIDNAVRYCAEGSSVTVKLEKNRIIVEDNGGGVNDEDLVKLGQRFYRPAGQNEKGSGLGLSIVYRIAELHHYQIRLENIKDINDKRTGLRVTILL